VIHLPHASGAQPGGSGRGRVSYRKGGSWSQIRAYSTPGLSLGEP
jgi:hypothetical protein